MQLTSRELGSLSEPLTRVNTSLNIFIEYGVAHVDCYRVDQTEFPILRP